MSLRAVIVGAITACAVAIIVARSQRPGARFCKPRDSHRAILREISEKNFSHTPRVLDLETGALSALRLPQGNFLDCATFSEWVDERGEWQVVGRWSSARGTGPAHQWGDSGLGRFSYPSGRPLDRLADCPVPASSPCWFPGNVPRVLFPSTAGDLYRWSFDDEPLGPASGASVQRLSWSISRKSPGDPRVTHVVWPKGLNGYLIASLYRPGKRYGFYPQRLWWLRLSADGLSVTDAGPLSDDEPTGDDVMGDLFPIVTSLPDGSHMLAYIRRHDRKGELFAVPLRFDSETGTPRIEGATAQKVADDVISTPAAFSYDGTRIYAVQRVGAARVVIRRFPVRQPGL